MPDVSSIISDILKKLKEQAPSGGPVCFDFTGSSPLVVNIVQRMLVERGYVALIALTLGEIQTERLYVSVPVKKAKVPKQGEPKAD